MSQKYEYDIIEASTAQEMAAEIRKRLNDGWQKAGQLMMWHSTGNRDVFIQEFIRLSSVAGADTDEQPSIVYEPLVVADDYIRDLLEINDIFLAKENGQPVTYFGEEKVNGITPVAILNNLLKSRHVPIDFDQERLLKAIGDLLCES